MIGFKEQKEIFQLIGSLCKRKIECLVAGGSAMLFYNFKDTTKGVDLILYSEEDRKYLEEILLNIKFIKFVEGSNKDGKFLPSRFEKEGFVFDLFAEGIFRFKTSPGIKERITEKTEFKNFIVNLISLEDIILLKSITNRQGDRHDVANIIEKANINWGVITQECLWQSENSYRPFGIHLFDFFEDLEDNYKVTIPKEVRNKITEIMGKQLEKFSKPGEENHKS